MTLFPKLPQPSEAPRQVIKIPGARAITTWFGGAAFPYAFTGTFIENCSHYAKEVLDILMKNNFSVCSLEGTPAEEKYNEWINIIAQRFCKFLHPDMSLKMKVFFAHQFKETEALKTAIAALQSEKAVAMKDAKDAGDSKDASSSSSGDDDIVMKDSPSLDLSACSEVEINAFVMKLIEDPEMNRMEDVDEEAKDKSSNTTNQIPSALFSVGKRNEHADKSDSPSSLKKRKM